MTENADVEWFRIEVTECASDDYWSDDHDFVIPFVTARLLLAHIDQLEAEAAACRSNCEDLSVMVNAQQDRRPTVHEIAAQMMAALVASDDRCLLLETLANESYRAAEALVAEGRRRDGSR